jgi:2-methylcitrate dehydratase PrpD
MESQKTPASPNLTLQLVEHVVNTRYDGLPQKAVEFCKLLIMDTFGVAFPGSRAPGCREVVELLRAWGGTPVSSLFAYPDKIAPPFAALANSMMMHAMDFDDTLDESALHTFVSVLPAALAASEYIGRVDGKRLIESLVLGVDIICRISRGIRRPLSWIRTATCGSFGAATAVGKLLNLNREQMTNALGIVYAQTSGNAQGLIEGRLVKRMQPGFASQAGVHSAFLAQSGITGSHQVFEGTYGFFNLYELGDYDPEPILKNIGSHFSILDLSIKPYPCCRMTHSSIDAARELRTSIRERIEEIRAIDVKVSKMVAEMVGKPFIIGTDPQVDAQFSIPYTVGTMLLRGDVFLEDFESKNIVNQRRKDLAAIVHVAVDDTLPAKDIYIASVTIQMKDGQKFHVRIDKPLGNPARPIGIDGCRDKFAKCVSYSGLAMDKSKQEKLLHTIENLEQLTDVRQLIELIQI